MCRLDISTINVLHITKTQPAQTAQLRTKHFDCLKIKRLVQQYNAKEKQVRLREPDLLMVITGGVMAYTRPDGVKVIPLGCMRN